MGEKYEFTLPLVNHRLEPKWPESEILYIYIYIYIYYNIYIYIHIERERDYTCDS